MISLVDKLTSTLDTMFLLVQTNVLLNIFEFWSLLSWHKAFEIFELIVRFLHVCKNKNNFSDINIITQPFKLHLKGIGLLIWTEKIEQNAVAARGAFSQCSQCSQFSDFGTASYNGKSKVIMFWFKTNSTFELFFQNFWNQTTISQCVSIKRSRVQWDGKLFQLADL